MRAPEKRPAPHGSAAATDPSPFEAARAKQARVSEGAKEVTRKMRGDRGCPFAARNVRRCRMPHSGDFPPDWEMFAHHFGLPPVDPARPCFPQKW